MGLLLRWILAAPSLGVCGLASQLSEVVVEIHRAPKCSDRELCFDTGSQTPDPDPAQGFVMTGRSLRSLIRARLGSGVVALLMLSGCAGTDATDSESDDQPYEIEAVVTPRPGMLDVEPVRIWLEWGMDDPRTMLVTFASQGPPCQVLDHFEVDEIDTRVTITLYHGRDPEADPDEPCDGPPDPVFQVAVPLSRDFVFEQDVLINGGSLTDGVDIDTMVTPQPQP